MNEFLTAHQALVKWAAGMPDRAFLHQPVDGVVRTITWREAEDACRRMATGLGSIGLNPGDKVAILAKNSAEWFLADIAIAMAGMISVPIYPTAGAETVSYILEHSAARAVFVGKLDEPSVATDSIPDDMPSIAFPYPTAECGHGWQALIDANQPIDTLPEPDPGDVMTILYTSGSTGNPKGVVISYGAYAYASMTTRDTVNVNSDDHMLSYLPLAHVTERTVTAGPAIYAGAECWFVESLSTFTDDLKRANPTIFISVPRLWVKFQAGVHAKIPPEKLNRLLSIPIVGGIVASKIRRELGFGRVRAFGSGSAPISPLTLEWYQKLGIGIGEGWGMSETSGLSCGNSPFQAKRIGTIGVPIEGTKIKLSDEGEILIKCPGLFSEYYKQPDLTAELFTEDGYFHTGDKAIWDIPREGYRITGRVKDIFKSAKGKYVTPVPIEAGLSGSALLEQICVMGVGLPAPVAVVVLSETGQKMEKAEVEASLKATLSRVNHGLESHERLARLIIVGDEWTTENGLLTPTLKVKRDVLESRYSELISTNYDAPVVWENS